MGLGPMTLGLTPILDAINDVWKEMMDMISHLLCNYTEVKQKDDQI